MPKSPATPKSAHPLNRWDVWLLPLAVFLLTIAYAEHMRQTAAAKDRLRFQYASDRIAEAVENRMATYISTLRGTRGFFAGSDYVSRNEFMQFARELNLEHNYPGMQGLGYSVRFPSTERDNVVRRMREDEGQGTFRLFPDVPDDDLHAILYLHPANERNNRAVGFNMFSEAVRRAAMEHARDTGEPTATAHLTLIQETPESMQAGFLIYLPVYRGGATPRTVEQRRDLLTGFVYSAFRADDLFLETFHREPDPRLDFTVYDGDEMLHTSKRFHSPLPEGYVARFSGESSLTIAGRPWRFVFASRPQFEATAEGRTEIWILLSGLLTTAVLVVSAVYRVRASRQVHASEVRRSQLLAELAQSEERYKSFIERSSEGIWRAEVKEPISVHQTVDEQVEQIFSSAVLAECNDAMAKMYGYERAGDLQGKKVSELLVPEDPNNWEYLRAFVSSGYSLADAVSHEHDRHGESVYFSNSFFGVVENERLVRAWGTQRDITQAKRAEEALLMSQQRLENLVMSSDDAIITKSLEGKILSWNPSAERMFGYTESEIVGGSILQIVPEDRIDEEIEILAKIARGERVAHLETKRRTKAGEQIFISVSTSPVKDPNGKIIGAAKIARDITDRRRADEALRESEERFKQLAEERNRLLDQERAARTELDRANRMKDDFLLTLSHELRTPLNAILGWSQLFARKKLDADQMKEGLAVIERNARSQAQIIDDLLDMNRIVSGKVRLESQELDLKAVIGAAVDTVTPAARAKEIRVATRCSEDSVRLIGDANRLSQVFWNLLSNAVKFTPKGGSVEIDVQTVGSNVEVKISDTGEGIKPEFLPFVFDRFRQADSSTTRQQGGLGLGLNIVKQLVELHGGRVSAFSPGPGQGSVFTVTLPWRVAEPSLEPFEPERVVDAPSVAPIPVDLSGRSILVVDDESDARELMKIVLTEYGAEVLMAGSSHEALRLLESHRVDLILSDIGMPEEDGYGFIKRVRALPRERGGLTPAIAITAFARREDRIRSIAAGFQMHVAKPVEPAELLAAVGSIRAAQKLNAESNS
ncbi:MAG: CHASE domain-containing protein [Bdellovibrionota bacterium]